MSLTLPPLPRPNPSECILYWSVSSRSPRNSCLLRSIPPFPAPFHLWFCWAQNSPALLSSSISSDVLSLQLGHTCLPLASNLSKRFLNPTVTHQLSCPDRCAKSALLKGQGLGFQGRYPVSVQSLERPLWEKASNSHIGQLGELQRKRSHGQGR